MYGKRKFTIALLALCMSFVGLLLGRLDGGNWVLVTTGIVGLYSGAEAVGKKWNNGGGPKDV
jgi:phosphatidylglycerophosphate synthase